MDSSTTRIISRQQNALPDAVKYGWARDEQRV
jgi:hypothetical protein